MITEPPTGNLLCDIDNIDLKSIIENGPIPKSKRVFLINGWRWHSKSVLRDLKRFQAKINYKQGAEYVDDSLLKCHDFVCGFNWMLLMKIESELFYPFLRKSLPPGARTLVDSLLRQHETVKTLSRELRDMCVGGERERERDGERERERVRRMNEVVERMISCFLTITEVQEEVFIPFISSHISEREQNSFNNRVLRVLGPINSQILLVGMSEAIECSEPDQKEERRLMRAQIPAVARAMLPLWRRRFYNPMTQCL
eukprot:CAMPEP_0182439480 /NCGR_PEP_ID=MMETSP1167-20130531/86469_1 /TAXON_ID=2988 /ORGANISM="Mallomonas Sp, Strain CCMP3275" /LENGTH=255 /DNA_ID=CAMNT_0024633203 /DNA_START=143 /DNA_END=906 /DNA_ORIENTATION=-